MSSRLFSTASFFNWNTDYTSPFGWVQFGAGLQGTDADGYYHDSSDPVTASIALSWLNDGTIPLGSTAITVDTVHRSSMNNDISAQVVYPYIRYNPGTPKLGASINAVSVGTVSNYSRSWATDPNNAAWTIANFFNTRFGVTVDQASTSGTPLIFRINTTLNFTLPAPVITTNAATLVTPSTATLNGTVNPSGATSTYPVQYRFEYGLTTSYGTQTTLTGPLTGSSGNAVNAPITGLTGFTTYHYRVVASNADLTVNGNDQTFSTGTTDRILMAF